MLRPRVVRTATVVAVLLLVLPLLLRPATPAQEVPATRSVDGVVISVASLERAIDFYTRVLTFELVSTTEVGDEGIEGARARIARLELGREAIDLVEHVAPKGRPVPADSRSNDRWFQHIAIIVNDMDQAYLWLRRHNIERISPEPQRLPDWNPNAGGIWAFYFKDPDGHALEILQFPPDKGAARWQVPSDKVFLGIDHTALVVGDTDASLRLYRDVLGLNVVGRSENHGPEQERLNAVAGARLRITTLRAADGPGIELLQYLAPRTGRTLPADARLNDLVAWQTLLTVASPSAPLTTRITGAGGMLVAPGVGGSSRQAATKNELVIRDADGHALVLRSR
jgi:catechol 2,3-dioxygenase-like lactoylglutathione lyase family enzyme